ncbi:hypothetical protein [Streptomyces sp. NRRL B-1381]|uniref:hypothetical protein n=1 Tax=Streptomyces sp. NRRL B-1381 TaxID=1463829 RepID=UPI0004BF12EA|nr:hypothetical protein [Streptomyces sp. NRRL B-1381]
MIERASETELRIREQLARRVCDALEAAGFTVHQDQEGRSQGEPRGVLLSVDPGEGLEGGVFVWWSVAHAFASAVMESVHQEGDHGHTLQHYGFVTGHMHATLLSVLKSAGFEAVDLDDDMDPFVIRVVR